MKEKISVKIQSVENWSKTMNKEMKLVCKYCGKEAPIDTEKSNENWKVYKQNEKCECGKCDYIPDILLDKN